MPFFRKKQKAAAVEPTQEPSVQEEAKPEPVQEAPEVQTVPCGEHLQGYIEEDTLFIEGQGETDKDQLHQLFRNKALWHADIHKIHIAEGCTKLGTGSFGVDHCAKVTELFLPESLVEIGDYACCYESEGLRLRSLHFPAGLKRIGDCSFFGCKELEELTLPEGLKEIGAWAFCGCKSLKELVIPAGIKTVKEGTFYGCAELRQVRILAEDVTIEERAFANCFALESVEIVGKVEKIEKWAFHGSMARFVIPADLAPERVDPRAFDKCTDPAVAKYQRTPTAEELREERERSLSKIENCPLYFYHGAAYVWSRLVYDGIVEPEYVHLRQEAEEETGHGGRILDRWAGCYYDSNRTLRKEYRHNPDMFFYPDESFGWLDPLPDFNKLKKFPFYTDCHLYDEEGTEISRASIVGTVSSSKPAVIGKVYLSESTDEKGIIHPIHFDAEWFQKIKITQE